MSKYLIKTIHSIAYNPINIIGELKRDLLLYDAVGMLTIDRIFKELAPLEHNHHIKNLFNELEFLIQNDKFIQLQRLFIEGDLNLSDNDNEIGAALNETKDKLINLKDEKEIRKLVILHEELSTRFWCIVANVTNENIRNVNKNVFELNFRTDQAINDVIADKIYTSAEFKKVKEIFMVRHFIRLGSTNLVCILG